MSACWHLLGQLRLSESWQTASQACSSGTACHLTRQVGRGPKHTDKGDTGGGGELEAVTYLTEVLGWEGESLEWFGLKWVPTIPN